MNNSKATFRNFAELLGSRTPWVWYAINLILLAANARIALYIPQLTGSIMMSSAGEFKTEAAIQYVCVQLFVLLFSGLISLSDTWAGHTTERNIQKALWRKIIRLGMTDFDRAGPSSLISRVTSDTMQATAFLSSLVTALSELYASLIIIHEIYSVNHTLAALYLIAIPYILVVMIFPGKILGKIRESMQETMSGFTEFVSERIANIRLVKAAANFEKEEKLAYAMALENYDATVRYAVVNAIVQPFTNLSQAALGAIALIGGMMLVSRGDTDVGMVITMYGYSSNLFLFFYTIITMYHMYKEAQGATATISGLMRTNDEALDDGISFTQPEGDIRFENVNFRYGTRQILKNVSFTLPAGKTTAIVGPSGSGKTTILTLLERLYEPESGMIWYGDTPANEIRLGDWRRAFGYLQQASPLITGTIRQNIEYGLTRRAVPGEVENAASLARADAFIDRLPDGLDTDIGSMGDKLSGGEKQRIALARLIIRNPDYILLDEATSALDTENTREVNMALDEIGEEKTVVMVTHDIHKAALADRIIIIEDGKVTAEGTHQELISNNSTYRNLYRLQEGTEK